jgi:hypothetical protein
MQASTVSRSSSASSSAASHAWISFFARERAPTSWPARQPPAHHPDVAVGHPDRIERARRQQPGERPGVEPVSLRPGLADAPCRTGSRSTRATCGSMIRAISQALPVTSRSSGPSSARTTPAPPASSRSARKSEADLPRRPRPRRSPGERLTRPTSPPPPPSTSHAKRETRWPNDTDGVGVDLGRGVSLAAGPFPQAALRTGRAGCSASGSPRTCRWSSGDQGLQALEHLLRVALEAALRPRRGDLGPAVAVVLDPHEPGL